MKSIGLHSAAARTRTATAASPSRRGAKEASPLRRVTHQPRRTTRKLSHLQFAVLIALVLSSFFVLRTVSRARSAPPPHAVTGNREAAAGAVDPAAADAVTAPVQHRRIPSSRPSRVPTETLDVGLELEGSVAKRLCAALEAAGLKPWLAELSLLDSLRARASRLDPDLPMSPAADNYPGPDKPYLTKIDASIEPDTWTSCSRELACVWKRVAVALGALDAPLVANHTHRFVSSFVGAQAAVFADGVSHAAGSALAVVTLLLRHDGGRHLSIPVGRTKPAKIVQPKALAHGWVSPTSTCLYFGAEVPCPRFGMHWLRVTHFRTKAIFKATNEGPFQVLDYRFCPLNVPAHWVSTKGTDLTTKGVQLVPPAEQAAYNIAKMRELAAAGFATAVDLAEDWEAASFRTCGNRILASYDLVLKDARDALADGKARMSSFQALEWPEFLLDRETGTWHEPEPEAPPPAELVASCDEVRAHCRNDNFHCPMLDQFVSIYRTLRAALDGSRWDFPLVAFSGSSLSLLRVGDTRSDDDLDLMVVVTSDIGEFYAHFKDFEKHLVAFSNGTLEILFIEDRRAAKVYWMTPQGKHKDVFIELHFFGLDPTGEVLVKEVALPDYGAGAVPFPSRFYLPAKWCALSGRMAIPCQRQPAKALLTSWHGEYEGMCLLSMKSGASEWDKSYAMCNTVPETKMMIQRMEMLDAAGYNSLLALTPSLKASNYKTCDAQYFMDVLD